MKKTTLIISFALLIVLAACSNNNNPVSLRDSDKALIDSIIEDSTTTDDSNNGYKSYFIPVINEMIKNSIVVDNTKISGRLKAEESSDGTIVPNGYIFIELNDQNINSRPANGKIKITYTPEVKYETYVTYNGKTYIDGTENAFQNLLSDLYSELLARFLSNGFNIATSNMDASGKLDIEDLTINGRLSITLKKPLIINRLSYSGKISLDSLDITLKNPNGEYVPESIKIRASANLKVTGASANTITLVFNVDFDDKTQDIYLSDFSINGTLINSEEVQSYILSRLQASYNQS